MAEAARSADILWFLPTHGDGHYLGTQSGARHVTLNYLSEIAHAADDLGYFGVLLSEPSMTARMAATLDRLSEGIGDRSIHSVGLAAPRGMLPFCGIGVPTAAALADDRQCAWTGPQRRSIRRDCRQHSPAPQMSSRRRLDSHHRVATTAEPPPGPARTGRLPL
jgi:hypothetical protein